LEAILRQVSLIVLSDYAKGALVPELVRWLMEQGRRYGVRVMIDPKGVQWTHYQGAALIKPNWSEARKALHEQSSDVQEVGERLLAQLQVEALAITRAQEGVSLFLKGGERVDFPAQVREVKDVTGAGDTVLAAMGAALACGATYEKATHLGNLAGGIAVEHVGCHRITLPELKAALQTCYQR
jgi:D-glycero-beta-D-manno-heptose-7-phosphate kinase